MLRFVPIITVFSGVSSVLSPSAFSSARLHGPTREDAKIHGAAKGATRIWDDVSGVFCAGA
jgi:hypothetical protein